MKKSKIMLDKTFCRQKPVDDRVFSAFVEHMRNVIYKGIYNPDHPTSDENGFRQDVIELVKDLDLTAIRYPGGNFICSYNWEDTVGPIERRPVRRDLAWGDKEPNIVGPAEFEKWLEKINSKLIMAVNLSTRDAVAAANEVEYFNYPEGTYYSELRKEHGHPQPYDVRVWCVGNEVDGPWNIGRKRAETYAWDAAEAAKAMKRIDPSIELVAVGSSGTQLDTYLEWDRIVLEAVYDSCDYISLHRYMGMAEIDQKYTYDQNDVGDYLELAGRLEQNIKDVIAACDYVKGRLGSKKEMNISLDEYNVVDIRIPEGFSGEDIGLSMEATLLFGLSMLAILRHSDRIKIACQSILINGSGMVMCEGDEDAWVNGTYYVFQHCSKFGRGTVLEQMADIPVYNTATVSDAKIMDSVCIYHEDTGELDIFAVNKTDEALEFEINAAQFKDLKVIEHLEVCTEDLSDRNSAQNPNMICPVSKQDITVTSEKINCVLNKYSWNVLRLKEERA